MADHSPGLNASSEAPRSIRRLLAQVAASFFGVVIFYMVGSGPAFYSVNLSMYDENGQGYGEEEAQRRGKESVLAKLYQPYWAIVGQPRAWNLPLRSYIYWWLERSETKLRKLRERHAAEGQSKTPSP